MDGLTKASASRHSRIKRKTKPPIKRITYQHHLKLGLRGLYNVALLIHRHKDKIDWPKLAQIARSWQAEKVIALILALASDLLGIAVPQIVTEELLEEIVDSAGLVTERQE